MKTIAKLAFNLSPLCTFAVLTAVSLLQSPALLAQDRGQETGNGGHFCAEPGKTPIPCDLYFEARDYQLDYKPSQKVELSRFSADVLNDLRRIQKMIWIRSEETLDLDEILPEKIQIYDAREFLGLDRQSIGKDVEAHQVGYAYSFRRRQVDSPGGLESVRVIELDMSQLEAGSSRYQALTLLHERLHFFPGLDHSVISPLIKDLDILLSLEDEQLTGSRRALTPSEMEASKDLQRQLTQLGLQPRRYKQMLIHPEGGGVTIYYSSGDLHDLPSSNFLPVNSAAVIYAGEAHYLKDTIMPMGEVSRPVYRTTDYGGRASVSLSAETATNGEGRRASG